MNKPYLFFGDHLRKKYGRRVLKLPVNANLSCPNRDGTLSSKGCIFCSDDGSASPTTSGINDISEQMKYAKENFKRSSRETDYIAYFQAYTNTNASIEDLKKLYDSAIGQDHIMGLMIGTRPDCLPDNILDLIASYKRDNFELWLEIGMQTIHEKSLEFLNRHHNHQSTRYAVERAAKKGIPICLHIILGIPGESWEDMMDTAQEAASMPIRGVKFHHLHVIKGTKLEYLYNKGSIKLLSLKEYTSILCDFIERLRPDIIIHRLTGDREESTLIAPLWGLHKGTVLKSIDDEFERRGTYQGFLYTEEDF